MIQGPAAVLPDSPPRAVTSPLHSLPFSLFLCICSIPLCLLSGFVSLSVRLSILQSSLQLPLSTLTSVLPSADPLSPEALPVAHCKPPKALCPL